MFIKIENINNNKSRNLVDDKYNDFPKLDTKLGWEIF